MDSYSQVILKKERENQKFPPKDMEANAIGFTFNN